MNGENFYLELKKELQDFFKRHGKDDYYTSKVWTNIITSKNKNDKYPNEEVIIDKVLRKIYGNIKLTKEYYRIDNIAWEYLGEGYKGNYKDTEIHAHRWKLLAAIEHENKSDDWTDELVKLAYINCPLRVVISYGDYGKKGEYSKAIEVANDMAADIHLENYVNTENQEFLLIFGPRLEDIKNTTNPKDISSMFSAFQWNGHEFK